MTPSLRLLRLAIIAALSIATTAHQKDVPSQASIPLSPERAVSFVVHRISISRPMAPG